MSLGRNINTPTINEVIALNRVAAADKSLIFLIIECRSGEIKSQTFSIAVLIISTANTNPMQKTTRIHSNRLIFNQTARKNGQCSKH